MGEHNESSGSIETKFVTLSEDGPGAYTLMFMRVSDIESRVLERVGFSSDFVMVSKIDSPPYTMDYDPYRFLRASEFTRGGSVINEFVTGVVSKDEMFDAVSDGEKYGPEEMEVMLDGYWR